MVCSLWKSKQTETKTRERDSREVHFSHSTPLVKSGAPTEEKKPKARSKPDLFQCKINSGYQISCTRSNVLFCLHWSVHDHGWEGACVIYLLGESKQAFSIKFVKTCCSCAPEFQLPAKLDCHDCSKAGSSVIEFRISFKHMAFREYTPPYILLDEVYQWSIFRKLFQTPTKGEPSKTQL